MEKENNTDNIQTEEETVKETRREVSKKKYKVKKGILKLFIVLIILMLIVLGGYLYYKYINSDKYLLTKKGYTEEQVTTILKDNKMTDILLERDYNEYIIDVMSSKYYLSKNLDSYLNYKAENKDKDINDVIAIINVGADKDWYEDPIETDTTKGALMLVNKFNYLTEDYEVDDLVDMSILYAFNGKQIKEEVYDAFKTMAIDAAEENLKLVANSAYRTYTYQKSIYTSYKNSKGTEYADSYAARAGHSEHQTGLSIDISTLTSTADNFAETKEFTWLINNAYKYGFILRYPEGKEYLTGYNYESWHYRYVGKEVAQKIHDEDITFDEYYAYYVDGE
jgi:LAS superfamily LD-carboxypeptidase LdcB